jgi:thiol-disulfide isomerase/thioredoxin
MVNDLKYMTKSADSKIVALYALAALLLAGCAGSRPQKTEPDDKGWVTRDIFDEPLYAPFRAGLDTMTVDPVFAGMVRDARDSVDVLIFFGGWCSDSKRQVPRFLKLADEAGVPAESIRLYALDRTKKSDDGMTARWGIERIPTIIFLHRGAEIGRITETPQTTMEGDVLAILAAARAH